MTESLAKQILITHGHLAQSRVVQMSRLQIVSAVVLVVLRLMLFSGAIYHVFFLKVARQGWPVVSQVVRLVVRDETAQRDRFMRENLDAMAVVSRPAASAGATFRWAARRRCRAWTKSPTRTSVCSR
jgi:heme A synthase